ncbi:hypothetical protein [Streptomyces microflavus]|uniref:hypothetical protein n=1 Tax=Streptomyces microflavus TaxID=1919 RepID=UPI002E36BAE6|nr:hypothetical protein [Streptomyces microflavus]
MKIIDLAEQTRLLGLVPGELGDLRTEIDDVRAGDISRPVREITPIAVRAHQLSIRCLQQLDTLSTSQYAAMKNGHEHLAHLSEAALRISVAASLCTYGITGRTDALLYEDSDQTAGTSRRYLSEAIGELDQAAGTYRVLAQNLSRRLASAAARAEDQPLIARAAAERAVTAVQIPTAPGASAVQARSR